MVVIRLAPGGRKNRRYFYIVVADSHARLNGRFIEQIGFHNPLLDNNDNNLCFKIDTARLEYWVSVGAQISPTIQRLLKTYNKTNIAA